MDKYISIKDAAEEVGVSRSTIRRWVAQGAVSSVRVGHAIRVYKDDVIIVGSKKVMWTIDNIARHLDVSPGVIYRLVAAGKGPEPVMIMRRKYFTEQSVADWIAAGGASCMTS